MPTTPVETALPPEQLYHQCDPGEFAFTDTSELEHRDIFFGQDRAAEALRFGVEIAHEGYNIFVLGPNGIGKHEMVRDFLERSALVKPEPEDWCYVNNFSAVQRPRVLRLPRGRANRLQRDMQVCMEDILVAIPGVFQSTEYKARVNELSDEFSEREQNAFNAVADKARENNIALVQTPGGYTLAPLANDKILSPEEFEALPSEERERIRKLIELLREDLKKAMRDLPGMMKESRERLKELNRSVTRAAVDRIFRDLEERYTDIPVVCEFLNEVKQDVVDNVDAFRVDEEAAPAENLRERVKAFPAYLVNALVDNGDTQGVPVIYENNPSLVNLLGRVEHESQFGALITHFMLIRPGSLHRANGGYLILDALKLLTQPFAWEALKRALQSRQLKIESADQILSLVSTRSLEPEPVPLDVKVILLGDPLTYYLLREYDPDFRALFKVPADLATQVPRSTDNNLGYARVVAAVQARRSLRPLDAPAVARVIEQGSRILEDASRLALGLNGLTDLLVESDYFAGRDNAERISAAHVQEAISAADARLGQLRERALEGMLRGIQLVASDGARVAQVNGLSVYQLGDFSFGCPARISARARLGAGRVLDIEREVKMGGSIHSKAVLILSALMASRYARDQPLPVSASLVFEQSYGGVEGDSASVAEFVALVSAITGIPVLQTLAVTGSLNQHGEVQAIGGVNHKIEGFFDLCAARGLNGSQGVVIPRANAQHLMLEQRVRDAVKGGQFQVHAVANIDEAMQLLLDTPVAEIDRRVAAQVDQWIAQSRKHSPAFAAPDADSPGDTDTRKDPP
ncbi:MAG: AAA family ATPase [Halioglobus sp.]|nr:AAA family ATPase [Halioglobus sp.]